MLIHIKHKRTPLTQVLEVKSVTRVGERGIERTLSEDRNKLRTSSYSSKTYSTLRGDEFTVWFPCINYTVPWRQQIQKPTPKIANHSHKEVTFQTADKATQEFSWSFSRIACHTLPALLCKRLNSIGSVILTSAITNPHGCLTALSDAPCCIWRLRVCNLRFTGYAHM